jgi:Spy/CpxP family protein refolding chaperone
MNVIFKRTAAAGALCLGIAAAAAAGAQDRPPPGPGAPPPTGARGADHRKMFDAMRAHREQRLHDLLQIRADQEGAFHAFVAALTPPERDDKGRRGPGWGRGPGGPQGPDAKPPLTTPERLDKVAARMAERDQRFQQIATATRTFYAALAPEQRKAFDELSMHGGGGHMMRGRFMRRGGPGGPAPFGPPSPPPPGA